MLILVIQYQPWGTLMNLCRILPLSSHSAILSQVLVSGKAGAIHDFHNAGGVPALLEEIRDHRNLACLTVDGEPMKERIRGAKVRNRGVIAPLDSPICAEGGLAVLKGNLAPDGAIVRPTSVKPEVRAFLGRGRVFESDQRGLRAVQSGRIELGP